MAFDIEYKYLEIKCPKSGRYKSIFTNTGKTVINNYIKFLNQQGKGNEQETVHLEEPEIEPIFSVFMEELYKATEENEIESECNNLQFLLSDVGEYYGDVGREGLTALTYMAVLKDEIDSMERKKLQELSKYNQIKATQSSEILKKALLQLEILHREKPVSDKRSKRGDASEKYIVDGINKNKADPVIQSIISGIVHNYCKDSLISITAEKKGGSSHHYDVLINLECDDKTIKKRGEVKTSSSTKYFPESINSRPWTIASQYLQANDFILRNIYCAAWYHKMIDTNYLSGTFNILVEKPSFEEWLSQDANMGDAKTVFGIELKNIVKNSPESRLRLINIKNEFVKELRNELPNRYYED